MFSTCQSIDEHLTCEKAERYSYRNPDHAYSERKTGRVLRRRARRVGVDERSTLRDAKRYQEENARDGRRERSPTNDPRVEITEETDDQSPESGHDVARVGQKGIAEFVGCERRARKDDHHQELPAPEFLHVGERGGD